VADPGDRSKVKVIDRRRFTSDGEFRDPAPVDVPAAPAARPAVEPSTPEAAPPATASRPAEPPAVEAAPPDTANVNEVSSAETAPLPPGPGIADVVDLLAQQAMAFLSGKVPGRGRDPATARYFIDLLGVLKEKTAGRLTLEETSFLEDVLYQLRSLYVAATR
jgi:hypothetical protein